TFWRRTATGEPLQPPRFRTIQVCPKDLPWASRQPEVAVSWHSGFRGGAHARRKTARVDSPTRRGGCGVADWGARAAADQKDATHRLACNWFSRVIPIFTRCISRRASSAELCRGREHHY